MGLQPWTPRFVASLLLAAHAAQAYDCTWSSTRAEVLYGPSVSNPGAGSPFPTLYGGAVISFSQDHCRDLCCEDTSCQAATFDQDEALCYLKTTFSSQPSTRYVSFSGVARSGQPTPPSLTGPSCSTKKGIAKQLTTGAQLSSLSRGISWWCDWTPGEGLPEDVIQTAQSNNLEFAPLLALPVQEQFLDNDPLRTLTASGNVDHFLFLNEPNFPQYAAQTPGQAADLYSNLRSSPSVSGLSMVSPAMNICSGNCVGGYTDPAAWLDDFFISLGGGLSADFDKISMHSYTCEAQYLNKQLHAYLHFNRPIWLTEFACGEGGPTLGKQLDYMPDALLLLELHPAVERYAWFSASPVQGADLLNASGGLNSLGEVYVGTYPRCNGGDSSNRLPPPPPPTPSPTPPPTNAPTPPPTNAPTPPPTNTPTPPPTNAPTPPPTNTPTPPPTNTPTPPPTNTPTPPPTNTPTPPPTNTPTPPPTNAPTPPPTSTPTLAPVRAPTHAPTLTPTRAPTPPTEPPLEESEESEDLVSLLVGANTEGDFDALIDAVSSVKGLASTLSASKLTVFAPIDAAFAQAGLCASAKTTEACTDITNMNEESLKSILLYHVADGSRLAADVLDSTVTTLNGGTFDVSADGIVTDSAGATCAIVATNLLAGNGVAHVIDGVLIPPTPEATMAPDEEEEEEEMDEVVGLPEETCQDLVSLLLGANSDGDFDALIDAVSSVEGLADILSTDELTVFAPTDAAFAEAGLCATAEALDACIDVTTVHQATLTAMLIYHVAPGSLLAADILGTTVKPLNGGTFEVSEEGVITDGSGATSSITATDLLACNGVAHVIDRVLMPTPVETEAPPTEPAMEEEEKEEEAIVDIPEECSIPSMCSAASGADRLSLNIYNKCMVVDGRCTVWEGKTEGAPPMCGFFGLPQNCRGCYLSCEGALAFLAAHPKEPSSGVYFCPSSGVTDETCNLDVRDGDGDREEEEVVGGDGGGGDAGDGSDSSTPSPSSSAGDAMTPTPIAKGAEACVCDGFGENCFMDYSCVPGMLGCRVKGVPECRFCEFGAYAGIACPPAGDDSMPPAPAPAPPTLAPPTMAPLPPSSSVTRTPGPAAAPTQAIEGMRITTDVSTDILLTSETVLALISDGQRTVITLSPEKLRAAILSVVQASALLAATEANALDSGIEEGSFSLTPNALLNDKDREDSEVQALYYTISYTLYLDLPPTTGTGADAEEFLALLALAALSDAVEEAAASSMPGLELVHDSTRQ